MKPFSNNVIFFDTEFSSLDPYKGEILSIGMAKPAGEELYLELESSGDVSPWVKENILPSLTGTKVSRDEAAKRILEFAGEGKPYLVSYVTQFDAAYLYKLLGINDSGGTKNFPYHWMMIDFASILFGLGINPESYYHGDKGNFYKEIGVDHTKYREHHALDDARILRDVYSKLASSQLHNSNFGK